MTTNEMLEARHTTWLQWCEPWPSVGPEGNGLLADVMLMATVHDCINLQRRVWQTHKATENLVGQDAKLLDEFMMVHWASVSYYVHGQGGKP